MALWLIKALTLITSSPMNPTFISQSFSLRTQKQNHDTGLQNGVLLGGPFWVHGTLPWPCCLPYVLSYPPISISIKGGSLHQCAQTPICDTSLFGGGRLYLHGWTAQETNVSHWLGSGRKFSGLGRNSWDVEVLARQLLLGGAWKQAVYGKVWWDGLQP